MKLTRYLLLVAVFALAGNLGATKNDDTKITAIKPGTSICIPCTHYCKTHPNAPQCN